MAFIEGVIVIQILENRDIVTSGRSAPKSAAALMALLNQHTARERQTRLALREKRKIRV